MAFYRITWNEKHRFATVHNYGCTFRCSFCSYKLRSGAEGKPGLAFPTPKKFLSDDEVKAALKSVPAEAVYFMGGEPTVAKSLPEILHFVKHELGIRTKLGHTNGSMLPLANLDGANVGFKAFDDALHFEITGRAKYLIYNNFSRAFDAGIELAANMVFVPGLVGIDQLEKLAAFLAKLDRNLPMHIMGYIPVPGLPHLRPTAEEMAKAEEAVRAILPNVKSSHLSREQAKGLSRRDDRFQVEVIAGDPLVR